MALPSVAQLALLAVVATVATQSCAASQWKPTSFQASTIMGAAFFNATHGFIAGAQNGEGPTVWATTDGGQSFAAVPSGYDLLHTACAVGQDGKTAVVGGFIAAQQSSNGAASFVDAKKGAGGPCQSVKAVQGATNTFVLTAQSPFFNGIAISKDGGVNYTDIDVDPINNNSYGVALAARFGAFPSPDVMYVTAGQWPRNPTLSEDFVEMSERMAVNPRSGELKPQHAAPMGADDDDNNNGNYYLMVAKSTDGGSTWTNLLNSSGVQYPNGIDCGDEDHCVFVGESLISATIYTTADGGSTWKEFPVTGKGASLTAVRFQSSTEVWVSGARFGNSTSGEIGFVYRSTDAGATWTQSSTFDNMYLNEFAFPSETGPGFASCYRYAAGDQVWGSFAIQSL